MPQTKFRFLDHKADAYVAAYGKTMEEAFENAALATFEVMTDTSRVGSTLEEIVEVEGFDKKALFYNWLETLLVKFDIAGNLYTKFNIEKIRRTSTGFKLKARIYGEKFDAKKHLPRVGVKAVTYHRMEIVEKKHQTVVKFILDI